MFKLTTFAQIRLRGFKKEKENYASGGPPGRPVACETAAEDDTECDEELRRNPSLPWSAAGTEGWTIGWETNNGFGSMNVRHHTSARPRTWGPYILGLWRSGRRTKGLLVRGRRPVASAISKNKFTSSADKTKFASSSLASFHYFMDFFFLSGPAHFLRPSTTQLGRDINVNAPRSGVWTRLPAQSIDGWT